MKRRFAQIALLLAAALVTVPFALAAKGGNAGGNSNHATGGSGNGGAAQVTSTIVLNQAGQELALGSTVTFTTTAAGLQGTEYPMVYVECSSDTDGSLLYGQLDHPDVAFVLGGGSSQWWISRGSAHCLAHLYAYGGKSGGLDTIRELTAPYAFNANG